MNKTLIKVAKKIEEAGGRSFLVGGSVRDSFNGIKDFDIEVFGLSMNALMVVLEGFGKPGIHGKEFAVVKMTIDGEDFDFSLPRRDSKNGIGHKGFDIEVDSNMTVMEAQSRRDFTINSGSIDILSGQLIDNFGMREDFENCILKPVSEKFSDDPLRVLRGFQFAGRFAMIAHPILCDMSVSLKSEFSSLPKERVWAEWEKWAEKSVSHSHGLRFLVDTRWIELFPEINFLRNCPQDPEWHPEGDVFAHMMFVVDAMRDICERDGIVGEDRVANIFGALCHDMGKPSTTAFVDGHWRSPSHDEEGVEVARKFMESIGAPQNITNKVCEMTRHHMRHVNLSNGVSPRAARRFSNSLKFVSLDDMSRIMEADHSGRPPLPKGLPETARVLIELAKIEHEAKRDVAILMGRHLIEMAVKPGVGMGVILKKALDAQMDDAFDNLEDAKKWVIEKELV